VADTTELVTAPGSQTGPGAGRIPRRPARLPKPLQAVARLAGIVPFAAYIILGLFIPLIAVLIGAFQNASTGAWTFSNIDIATHGAYLKGFENSLELSLIASILPGIFGLLIAYAIFTAKRGGKVLRQMVITASGVFANFGGVPLAFLFIASLASTALVTGWLNDIGLNIYSDGFTLFDLAGVAVVYMYFQIPLMVLIILPALEGLRPAWR
jgi:putative spermidine/putrescine transport system permease protein